MDTTASEAQPGIHDRVVVSSASQRARRISVLALVGAQSLRGRLVYDEPADVVAVSGLGSDIGRARISAGSTRDYRPRHCGDGDVFDRPGSTPVVVPVVRRWTHRGCRVGADLAAAVAAGSSCAGASVGANRGDPW